MKVDLHMTAHLPHLGQISQTNDAPPAALNPIPMSAFGDIILIGFLAGKTSLMTSDGGNTYVLAIVDLFTRFALTAPMPTQTARTVLDLLLSRWTLLPVVRGRIRSDEGTNFEALQLQNLSALWQIVKEHMTSYFPAVK